MRWLLFAAAAALGCGTSTTNPAPADSGSQADTSTADAPGCSPACTGANITCDPADDKCKRDGTTTNVGAPCGMSGADPVCGTDPNATCNDLTQDGFPGGYCSVEPCSATELCPVGASCAHLGGEANACWKNCSGPTDCRAGYECLSVDPLYTSGASHKVCFLKSFPCNTSADCPTSKSTCKGANPDAGTTGLCQ